MGSINMVLKLIIKASLILLGGMKLTEGIDYFTQVLGFGIPSWILSSIPLCILLLYQWYMEEDMYLPKIK
jgi:hypothetical protein